MQDTERKKEKKKNPKEKNMNDNKRRNMEKRTEKKKDRRTQNPPPGYCATRQPADSFRHTGVGPLACTLLPNFSSLPCPDRAQSLCAADSEPDAHADIVNNFLHMGEGRY